ncbi:Secretin GspD 2 (General secretion pathway protein D 2) (GspD) (GspD-beta secretin) (Type II secretion system protein D 2) (T2SS protein D) [Durusdinium trenchii]|uniref:Secretin GspD 2 (General secretion pathway protein D 2) (GspD) (GspD-beta secretin) (Type II secretion system protein D 2) (T2SS protein D) n=1 Tax=Durusdinium trenchii TaxID=1381693 RepID=A0ABP0RM11_9DINO
MNAQVVADEAANRLLVSGSPEVHRITVGLIQSLDTPPRNPRPTNPSRMETYPCPPGQLDHWAQIVANDFANRPDVRVSVDRASGQLIVVAPEDVHQAVTGRLFTPAGQTPTTPNQLPATRSGNQIAAPRYYQLRNTTVEEIEPIFAGMMARRVQPNPNTALGLPGYEVTDATGKHASVGFSQIQQRVVVGGTEPLAGQLLRLFEVLDASEDTRDHTVRIVPLGKADLSKVRSAVEAYQNQGQDPNSSAQPNRLHDASSAHDATENQFPVRRAAFEAPRDARPFQVANLIFAQQPAEGPPPRPEDEGDQSGDLSPDIEVEALPDLDVIILRGDRHDVDEVLRIIEEIERLSAEEQPIVEVYSLKHVGNEQVGELITKIETALLASRQGRVSVTPLGKPNALLLIGRGDAVEVVKDLLVKLDQPVSPDSSAQVFRLEHAAATAVATTIEQFLANRENLGTKAMVTPDVRSNSLVVHASPRDMQEIKELVQRLDVGESQAVNQLQVFHLRNTLASDLGPLLQAAITGQGGGRAQDQRSSVLQFLTIEPGGERLLKSGILNDVQVTPDPRTNTLLVSAPAESMALIGALIEHLDQLPAAVVQIKVFKIINGEASSLVQMLQTLLGTSIGVGPQLPRAESESSLAPLRFSVDERTNSIIASGSAGDLTIVEAILLRLDEKDIENRRSTIFRLRNAPAIDVAVAINEFLRSERQVQQAAPGAFSPFRQIESEVVVVPEPVSNALIISATPRFYDEIMELVEDLDEQPPQVMIQVLIAEVQLNNTDEFGIELGLQDSILFDRSILGDLLTVTNSVSTPGTGVVTTNDVIVSATNSPGFAFNGAPLGNSGEPNALANSGTIGTQGLSNFAVGRVNTELGYGGLVLSASSDSVSALVRALQESRRLDVLSRPQVMTLDNQPAFIQVGQRVPRITGTTINQFSQVNTIDLENVGLILGVTPRISPEGMVVMEIDAEKSNLGPDAEGIPISISSTGDVIRSPRINTTRAQTTVSAADGQTIVLGGLITNEETTIARRVPCLSDIPIVGMLFRYDAQIDRRSELLIVLTPHVVRDEADAERIRQIESARMHWCMADVVKLHGDGTVCHRGDCVHCQNGGEVIYPDGMPVEMMEEGVPIEVIDEGVPVEELPNSPMLGNPQGSHQQPGQMTAPPGSAPVPHMSNAPAGVVQPQAAAQFPGQVQPAGYQAAAPPHVPYR